MRIRRQKPVIDFRALLAHRMQTLAAKGSRPTGRGATPKPDEYLGPRRQLTVHEFISNTLSRFLQLALHILQREQTDQRPSTSQPRSSGEGPAKQQPPFPTSSVFACAHSNGAPTSSLSRLFIFILKL